MKRIVLYLAIAFQVLALAWIAAKREWIVQTGETVYIRSAPIDPRDIFRGDYVRLNYEASTFSKTELRDGLLDGEVNRGSQVYVPLEIDARGLASAQYVTDLKPDHPPFLRGYVLHHWLGDAGRATLQVKYGIEQYFVEQGKGLAIEQQRGTRSGIQQPMEIELALDSQGTAIIKGYRWSPLGIGLAVKRAVERDPLATERSAVLELTLQNASDSPLSIVMLPDLCSFQLISVKTASIHIEHRRPECERLTPRPEHLLTLAPEESRAFTFDFNTAPWLVNYNNQPTSIGTLKWDQRFRLVYRSPPAVDTLIKPATHTWQGELPSRAFHGGGQID
ncbi:MAG: hypothetical protein C0631_09355 [Sedimenticola sp.]|nr:MAG: hypothetical protein C0631_09355 [Sedimenticola sp.]